MTADENRDRIRRAGERGTAAAQPDRLIGRDRSAKRGAGDMRRLHGTDVDRAAAAGADREVAGQPPVSGLRLKRGGLPDHK